MSGASGGGGYDPAFFATLDAVEERHFWFRARRRVVAAVLRPLCAALPDGHRVLELGCGNGGMLKLLRECAPRGRVMGMDLYAEALRNARLRANCPLVQGDVRRPPFGCAFDVVGMFDVLEHVADDLAMLRDARALLAPGGALLLTVPAEMALWSYFDVAARHARRYELGELRDKLEVCRLTVEYATPFMGAIYPLVRLGRAARQALGAGRRALASTRDDLRITPGVNAVLGRALAGEATLVGNRRRVTRGTSLLALARRRD